MHPQNEFPMGFPVICLQPVICVQPCISFCNVIKHFVVPQINRFRSIPGSVIKILVAHMHKLVLSSFQKIGQTHAKP